MDLLVMDSNVRMYEEIELKNGNTRVEPDQKHLIGRGEAKLARDYPQFVEIMDAFERKVRGMG